MKFRYVMFLICDRKWIETETSYSLIVARLVEINIFEDWQECRKTPNGAKSTLYSSTYSFHSTSNLRPHDNVNLCGLLSQRSEIKHAHVQDQISSFRRAQPSGAIFKCCSKPKRLSILFDNSFGADKAKDVRMLVSLSSYICSESRKQMDKSKFFCERE